MREIKSFINSVLHLMKITKFDLVENHARSFKLNFSSFEIKMFNTDAIFVAVHHANGNQIIFIKDNIAKKNIVTVSVSKFGSSKMEISHIDLDIEDETDYFNYTVQNNPGKLTLDDISVLKEILTLALEILNNERN